jgi:hypothetical protein
MCRPSLTLEPVGSMWREMRIGKGNIAVRVRGFPQRLTGLAPTREVHSKKSPDHTSIESDSLSCHTLHCTQLLINDSLTIDSC